MSSITPIGPKGDRKYRARYRTPDGASRSKTFKLSNPPGERTKHDAEVFLDKMGSSAAEGAYVDRSAGVVKLADWGDRWIDTRRGRDGAPLRPRTQELYRQLLGSHIAPKLGGVALRDLTPATVRAWHAGLPGSTAPAKAYRLLRAMMATAVDDQMISANPCRTKGAGVERAPERPLPTGDEVWRLADAIDDRYRALVLLTAFVGLRWGELVGLRRGDVDLTGRVVHVARQVVEVDGHLAEGPPKSAAGVRTVAVPPAVIPELSRHLDLYTAAGAAAPVFIGPKGALLRRSNFNKLWSKARAEVGRPELHLHDLRHFANTLAASAGASTRELMSRLGHASPAAALRYQHATAQRDRVIADRMDDLIAGRDDGGAAVDLRVLRGG